MVGHDLQAAQACLGIIILISVEVHQVAQLFWLKKRGAREGEAIVKIMTRPLFFNSAFTGEKVCLYPNKFCS